MSVPAAFIGVVIIWSTTPLAIQWSSDGPGFLFGVLGRTVLGAVLCLSLVALLRVRLPWDRAARHTYLAAMLGVYGTLLCVYWGSQFIPSGLVSVLFGLTPIVTSVIAAILSNEQEFTPGRSLGMLLGLGGLGVIFGSSVTLGPDAIHGIAAVLAGVILHSLSTVLVKRIDAPVSALAVTSGTLILAAPLYAVTWLVFDGAAPAELPVRAAGSIAYLGVVGSAIAFILYYYVLQHVAAGRIALITLIAPVTALWLGHVLNDEPFSLNMLSGTALVLGGLAVHYWGDSLLRRQWPARRFGTSLKEGEGD